MVIWEILKQNIFYRWHTVIFFKCVFKHCYLYMQSYENMIMLCIVKIMFYCSKTFPETNKGVDPGTLFFFSKSSQACFTCKTAAFFNTVSSGGRCCAIALATALDNDDWTDVRCSSLSFKKNIHNICTNKR